MEMSGQQKENEKNSPVEKSSCWKTFRERKLYKSSGKIATTYIVSNWKATGIFGATRTEIIHRNKCSETKKI